MHQEIQNRQYNKFVIEVNISLKTKNIKLLHNVIDMFVNILIVCIVREGEKVFLSTFVDTGGGGGEKVGKGGGVGRAHFFFIKLL